MAESKAGNTPSHAELFGGLSLYLASDLSSFLGSEQADWPGDVSSLMESDLIDEMAGGLETMDPRQVAGPEQEWRTASRSSGAKAQKVLGINSDVRMGTSSPTRDRRTDPSRGRIASTVRVREGAKSLVGKIKGPLRRSSARDALDTGLNRESVEGIDATLVQYWGAAGRKLTSYEQLVEAGLIQKLHEAEGRPKEEAEEALLALTRYIVSTTSGGCLWLGACLNRPVGSRLATACATAERLDLSALTPWSVNELLHLTPKRVAAMLSRVKKGRDNQYHQISVLGCTYWLGCVTNT